MRAHCAILVGTGEAVLKLPTSKSFALIAAASAATLPPLMAFAQDRSAGFAAQTQTAAAALSEQEILVANLALSIDFNDPDDVARNMDEIANIIVASPNQLENLLDAALALSVDPVQLMSAYADVASTQGAFDSAAAYEAILAVAPEEAPGLVGVMLQYRPSDVAPEEYVGEVLSTAAKFAPDQSKRIIVAAAEQLGLREGGAAQGPIDIVHVAASVAKGAAEALPASASNADRADAAADLVAMVEDALTELGAQNVDDVMKSVGVEAGVALAPTSENQTETGAIEEGGSLDGQLLDLPETPDAPTGPDDVPNVSNAGNGVT